MQLTIEIPEELAGRLETERGNLAEIIERGLQRNWAEATGMAREVVAFLARGPQPDEILSFRPSEQSAQRIGELLERNRTGNLTADEEAEMDEIEALDNFMTVLKARARRLAHPVK